jgi:hypothetical protein
MSFRKGVVSFAAATALVLAVPVVILAVGLPIVLAVRALVEAAGWMVRLVSG